MVFNVNTESKTEHTIRKSIKNWAENWCQITCGILFDLIYSMTSSDGGLSRTLEYPTLFWTFWKKIQGQKTRAKILRVLAKFQKNLKILTQIKRKILGNSYGMAKNLNPNWNIIAEIRSQFSKENWLLFFKKKYLEKNLNKSRKKIETQGFRKNAICRKRVQKKAEF